ncbi:efflux RND transporter periplasmic adaptor subunit [Marinobacter xiaoshiensis]|uniref:Efflux RND transporter periplasmic adaptor subunit n=1 Tax=Marinobacter xiaoshiensis TaxID=3073652 RepID=A0ABU2HD92_9GAMM|nr:efflux RND transporter periplasmic adaptor subunit [Marinobacter sp. F60267]MDS1309049.1 efflux RND transporter periplasmic adaptor subunit [Marinobacter sp. F60267]
MNLRLSTVLVLAGFILSGCESASSSQDTLGEPQPPSVEVVTAVQTLVKPQKTYTTRIEATENVILRPRIFGVIDRVLFVEGEEVAKGDVLFQLDGRQLEARVSQLQSELARAKAALGQAENESRRASRLLVRKAISEELAEVRESERQQARAIVSSIRAQLREAELNFSYTIIRSPIDGVVSRANITAGNTVSANQSVLTSITSNQDRYAYFDMDERTWYRFFSVRERALGSVVRLQLTGEGSFPHVGQIDFVDNSINIDTGTIRLRALIAGSGEALVPGAFARLQVSIAEAEQKIVVPDRAVATDLNSRFVLTVSDSGETRYTPVKTGERLGALRVIEQGLSPGDTLVANGVAKVGPDMTITPVLLDEAQLQATAQHSSVGS